MVDCDHLEQLLEEFALVDADGRALKGIRMIGVIKKTSKTHLACFLDATSEVHHVPHSKVESCAEDVVSPIYYVVVGDKVVDVKGLLLPTALNVEGYQLLREDAVKELKEIQAKKGAETAVASAAVVPVPTPAVTVPTPPPTPTNVSTTSTTPTTTTIMTTPVIRRRRRDRFMTVSEEKATESKVPDDCSSTSEDASEEEDNSESSNVEVSHN